MRVVALLGLISMCSCAAAAGTHRKLVSLAAEGGGIIKLDADSFELLATEERDWSTAIEFTSLDPKHNCVACEEFHPPWKAVAKAWTKVPKEQRDRHFFATFDFADSPRSQQVFRKLELRTAPVVFVYPATKGPHAADQSEPARFDLSEYGEFEADRLAEHLSRFTPIPIPYVAPFPWARWVGGAAGLLVLALLARVLAPVLQNRWTWATGAILSSLVMTSGYMFTRIRASPWRGADGGWVARGNSNMFGQEVPLVAMFYGTLGLAFIMLIMVIPNQPSARQRLYIYFWTGVIMIVYSMVLVFVRAKNRYYPWRFLL
ncbi:dolichyl-diphosphooligosaccharide-protein glycotransferase [Mycena pura]|uniref:Dolichyl-diphosphooligosaccharide-protein glycotransferase n=1 Tax=Mycena pura TaxID=153505 RepID=A0AAD6V6C3_9AGAR|nr:dolichyl-diphosphooligosaccharide-protein glycotransferase [Mycena pura]